MLAAIRQRRPAGRLDGQPAAKRRRLDNSDEKDAEEAGEGEQRVLEVVYEH